MLQRKLTSNYLFIDFLIHPLPIFCVFITFFNDHWLKAHFAGVITGKLSDICGLFYFPLLLCAFFMIVRRFLFMQPLLFYLPKSWLVFSILLTGVIFVLVKVYPPATAFYITRLSEVGINAKVTRDFSDLSALPILILTYWFGRRFF